VEKIVREDPRLILPVGALVQHGPHLPLGTNTFIAEEVAKEVSALSGILLSPTFPYGVRGPEHDPYAGSAGLQRKTLHRALNELLSEWEDCGIQEFILLTAHRHEPHLDALLMAMPSTASITVINLYTIQVEDLVEGSPQTEHAGELETSLLLYLDPHRVVGDAVADVVPDERTYRKYARGRVATPPPGSKGVLGMPTRASSEKGRAVFLRYIQTVQEILVQGEEEAQSTASPTP
jgi:creatinine amidohydrolase